MSNKLDLSKELIGHRALVTGGSRGMEPVTSGSSSGTILRSIEAI